VAVTVQDILVKLPELTYSELELVRQKIQSLKSLGKWNGEFVPAVSNDTDSEVMDCLSVICKVLLDAGLEYNSVPRLRKSHQFSSFQEKLPSVLQYFQQIKNKPEKMALFELSIRLLYEDLCSMSISVTARTLMSHIHRVPAVFNKSFPGYVQGGALPLFFRRK
jgi:hypothetical protein